MQTLLIANRGEIAVRIIRTARTMGLRTVAVFSAADQHSLHVKSADSAVYLGEGSAADTYLNIAKLLQAAKDSQADAVHPGYGFLSESAEFAETLINAGVIWVGPPISAMQLMSSKATAKQTLAPKGVPMIPGYHGIEQGDERLIAEAADIGFPLLVKASAGGGGKGMRVVESIDSLPDALASARREALHAFGSDQLLLEKFLAQPRHVEVQIMADQHGKVISLFERDCSAQRRHQKVLEEAPAPGLAAETRQAMWLAAETVAREIQYVGAGTVEFILAPNGEFYFLEMNTRLQVEHPVTEAICDVDLVAWQLRVAAGEPLAIDRPAQPTGHAIEVRLYAEDPAQNFQPSVGVLEHLDFPSGAGLRVDSGVASGDQISGLYDPMLAKLIAHGTDRADALSKLQRMLSATRLIGFTTNLRFLRQLVQQPEVRDMRVHTRWLDEADFYHGKPLQSLPVWAALASVQRQLKQQQDSVWQRHHGWRMDGSRQWQFYLAADQAVTVTELAGVWAAQIAQQSITVYGLSFEVIDAAHGRLTGCVDGQRIGWDVFDGGDTLWLDNGDRLESIRWWQPEQALTAEAEDSSLELAQLPGVVTAIFKQPGERIKAGDKVLAFEAMKMEIVVSAKQDGVLDCRPWQVGDQLCEGDCLFDVQVAEA